jgi:predicted Fe-S protein YdhL (DUF1289 family)
MQSFKPCLGKTVCRDNGDVCLSCGRSLAEVARTRELIEQLSEFVLASDYDNVQDFADYLARKLVKKVEYRREAGVGLRVKD